MNDDTLTKVEKLDKLQDYGVLKVEQFTSSTLLDAWENELRQIIINEQPSINPEVKIEGRFLNIVRWDFQEYCAYSYINYIEELVWKLEELELEAGEPEPTFVVAYSESPIYTLEKTATQIIDCVYDFCVKNRVWGFKYY